jgi:hypothetical protein
MHLVRNRDTIINTITITITIITIVITVMHVRVCTLEGPQSDMKMCILCATGTPSAAHLMPVCVCVYDCNCMYIMRVGLHARVCMRVGVQARVCMCTYRPAARG